MKSFMFLALLLHVSKCDHSSKPPYLFEATSQHWSGGAAGSGHGYNFNFYLRSTTMTGYTFDSLWMDDKRFPLLLSPTIKGDTVQLSAEEYFRGQMKIPVQQPSDTAAEPTVLFPIVGYQGAALLGYWYKGKRGYVAVKDFVHLPALNYP